MSEEKQSDVGNWYRTLDTVKVVEKPWGREIWLNYGAGEEVGDEEKPYVMKMLHIKAGTQTSYQSHVQKVETNCLLQGRAEVWFENDRGVVEKKVLEKDAVWSIPAGRKHRILPLTDIVLMESSTPHVDDVIRHDDAYERGSGRIQSEHDAGYKNR